MRTEPLQREPEFDEYASRYDEALDRGLSLSGEDKNYFAERRITWLANCLDRLKEEPQSIMDLGCGTGSATPFFLDRLQARSVLGIDTSVKSLEVAKRMWGSKRARFLLLDEYRLREQIDLVFCNGVFHHVPVFERSAATSFVYRSLRPGGLFAFWDNNPWNPGTRCVMRRIPFDRDAVLISSAQTRHLLRATGFKILRTDFLFIFPKSLRWLRGLEPLLCRLPLGAQYQVLARKP
jgi:SAM-dependent methyltransferase